MFQRIINYFISSYQEMRKVIWPNRQTVISHTIIVVIAIATSMGIIAILDLGLLRILEILVYK